MFFKVAFGSEIHILNASQSIKFFKLSEFIREVFKKLPSKYNITYQDSDGDTICLFNDLDLKILMESGVSKVKLTIQEVSEDFYDETQQIEVGRQQIKQVFEPVIKEEPKELDVSSIISNSQNLDESISEKLEKLMPELISKIKQEIVNESKIKIEPKKVEEKTENKNQVIHRNVTCDGCGTYPIVGIRYKCAVCADFDLCEKCESTTTHDHPFLKIKHLGQTPAKIVVVLDSEDEGLEINGNRIPLNGLGATLNHFGQMFKQGGGRCPAMNKYREAAKSGLQTFFEQMKTQCEQKREEKVEQPKVDQKVEEVIEEKIEEKVEVKVEEKVEVKVEEKVEEKVEVKEEKKEPVILDSEDVLIDAANYLSDVLEWDFNSSMRYAKKFPGFTREQMLMNYIDGK